MARRIISILIVMGFLTFVTACNLPASNQSTPIETKESSQSGADPQVGALEAVQSVSTDLSVQFEEGFPVFVSGRIPVEGDDPGERALSYLEDYKALYLQDDPALALKIEQIGGVDGQDVTVYQLYNDIPVFAGEMVLNLDGSDVTATYGKLLTGISVDTVPAIPFQQAEEISRALVQSPDAVVLGESQLVIFDLSLLDEVESQPHLAWQVTLGEPVYAQIFVDAHTGEEVFQYGLGMDSLDLDFKDANYTDSVACYFLSTDDQTIGDEHGLDPAYYTDVDADTGYVAALDVYDFYLTNFRRDSYNGTGGGVEVYIHTTAPNARYIGYGCHYIEFADGWVSWDVMVHEFTHAVIGNSSGLVYANQSGALNEGYSDLMGYLADPEDFTVAEDRTSGMGPIRDISNPPRFGQPDRFPNYVNMTADNGGVHTNSGILNKAGYLIAVGGNFNTWTIDGIGNGRMGALFYAVMTSLPSGASFMTARNATVARADATLPPRDACQVQNAFAAVDLGEGDRDCDGIDDNLDPNIDGDFIPDDRDNCPLANNPRQEDVDGDGIGDACDPDADGDTIPNSGDNCPLTPNPGQLDSDGDGVGDNCQDSDFDGTADFFDNCPTVANSSQSDVDGDFIGDACDSDADGDSIQNSNDNCPLIGNTSQADSDGDGIGNACDNCRSHPNPDQADTDGDGIGDTCDSDADGDTIPNDEDNCPADYNPDQWDQDNNGTGQACDEDENLTRWGIDLPFDLFGRPDWLTRVPIPICLAGCPDYFSPDYLFNLELGGFGPNVKAWISDDTGQTMGSPVQLDDGGWRMQLRPFAGREYFLNFAFGPDFPEDGQEFGSMSMYASSAAEEPPADNGQDTTPEPTATFTPTPSTEPVIAYYAEPETVDAGKCTTIYWKVSNVKNVEFGGFDQEFEGSYNDCICKTSTYPMTITYLDDTREKFYVTIEVEGACATPTPKPQPPAKPTGLDAKTDVCNGNSYNVGLTWKDNASNETGYRVLRNGNVIATLGPNIMEYKDTPPYGGPYTYQVEAFNGDGSSFSNKDDDPGCLP